jgi:type VI secretion system secreted protein Hcp
MQFQHRLNRLAFPLALAVMALPASLFADIYMTASGPSVVGVELRGDSVAQNFVGAIQLQSFSTGASAAVSQTARGITVGKPALNELSLSKQLDPSSPKLHEALTRTVRYTDVVISQTAPINDGEQAVVFKIELKDAFITSWEISSGGERPTESVTIAFSAIRYTYTPFDEQGRPGAAVTTAWNIVTGKPEFRTKSESEAQPVVAGDKPASTGTEITVEE